MRKRRPPRPRVERWLLELLDPHRFNPWKTPWPLKRHDVRRLARGFETPGKAHKEQVSRRRRLFAAARSREAREEPRIYAEFMKACVGGKRCLLSICPKCMRRNRIWLGGEMQRLFEREPDLIFVTIIPPRASAKQGLGLNRLEAKRLKDWLRQLLYRLGCEWTVIGGIDGTYEVQEDQWQLHFHLLAPAVARPVFEGLRPYCTETPTGSDPVRIDKVGDADRAYLATYCCKGFWWQRVRYVDENGKPRSREVRLSSRRHAEWLLWRGEQELNALTFLYGVRREGRRLVRTS